MARRSQREPWSPPADFDEYRLIGALGKGGMGQVYLAHDQFLDRTVAVKFLLDVHDSSSALERFRIEARAIARLQHPNVVVVHRIGQTGGYPYIVSEHIRGQSLAALPKPVPWQRALEIGIGLARGLAAAHARGVLHRDIKAANAMLADDGSVKLLDFGLAKLTVQSDAPTSATPSVRPSTDPATAFDQTRRPDDNTLPEDDHTPATAEGGMDTMALQATAPPSGRPSAPASQGPDVGSLTHAGALLGTPLYMSPEAWRSDPLTPASDVYSLGVVLFELCAGRPPHHGPSLAQLAAIVSTQDAPPLADVDPSFGAVIARCLARDPAARFPSAIELRDALEELAAPARGAAVPEGNPYRGLHAFEAEHRALFFGRDRAIREVVDRLRGEGFVLVAGDSGAGKSSLCRAGVVPAILDGALEDGRRWRVARMLPSAHPLQALVAAIALAARLDEAELLAATRAEPAALARTIRRGAGDETGVIVLIDQLEELVTISEPAEAELATEAIRQLAILAPSIRVLATVRGDFLTRVAAKFGRPDEIVRAVHLLLPPDRDELRSAIVGPARLKGVAFESDALVDQLVEAGARAEGGLPLLQFALAQLWSARGSEKTIRASTLSAIGGVEGALARHADDVLARLLPAQREAARRILLRLVTAEGTRTRRSEAELVDDAAARTALDALVRGRLLVAREGDDGAVYEVAHEALLHGWTALREWHEQSREARAVAARLEHAAKEWDRLGHPAELLWSDRQLAELAAIEAPRGREATFVSSSRAALRRRRRLRVGAIAIAFTVLSSAVVVLLYLRAAADRERVRAEQLSATERERYLEQLVEQGRQALLDGDSLRAAGHLARAHDEGVRDRALGMMLARAVQPLRAQLASKAVGGPVRYAAFDARGTRIVVVRAGDPVASVYDAAFTTERRLEMGERGGRNAAFDPVGARVATSGTAPAIWPLADTVRLALEHDGTPIETVAWADDGSFVAGRGASAVRVWDATTGKLRHRWPIGIATVLEVHGSRIVAGDAQGVLHLWDVTSGAKLAELTGHASYVHDVDVSADGMRLASASEDGTARIWQITGKTAVVLQHKAAVRSIAFGPATTVLTASSDRSAMVWSEDGRVVRSLDGHRTPFAKAIFDPTATRIATAGADGRICLHELASGSVLECLEGHRSPVTAVAFDPTGTRVLSASVDGTVRLWQGDVREYAAVFTSSAPAGWLAFSPDGKTLITTDGGGTVTAIDVATRAKRWSTPAHDPGQATLKFSRDGRTLLTTDDVAKLWDLATGNPLAALAPAAGIYFDGEIVGEQLVLATDAGSLEVRAVAPPHRTLHTLAAHQSEITSIALTPDRDVLATASADRTVRMFDTATWTARATLAGHTGPIYEITFSPDGALLASSSGDGSVRIWSRDGASRHVLVARNAGVVFSPRFSHDGTRLFTAHEDGHLRVWSTQTGRELVTLRGHETTVSTLAVATNGALVASGAWDGSIILWDTTRWLGVTRLQGHNTRIAMLAFAPDGRSLVSAATDRTVKLWTIDDGGPTLDDELALVKREQVRH